MFQKGPVFVVAWTEKKGRNLLGLLQQPPVQHGTALDVPSPRSVKVYNGIREYWRG